MNNKNRPYIKIRKSIIHGEGVFLNETKNINSILGIGIEYYLNIFPTVTKDFGSMINHSYNPNCRLKYNSKKNVYEVVSIKRIHKNNEITLNYNDTPWFINNAESYYK